tara:strand:+ start:684 stop:1295 length:612 start_codon:yes stop_codon:yes gene_type:complete
MKNETRTSKRVAATGIIAALAASSCCIPPIIAAIAGVGGAAGSLSWMEPLRPYLIGLAIVAIGYAWYNHLKSKSEDDCGCEIEKPKWYQTRSFLVGITLFAAVSISIPYYSHIFFSDNKKEVVISDVSQIEKVNVDIEGMTCDACQSHIEHAVNELDGIINVKASYSEGGATVKFDKTQTSIEEIKRAVNSTGYKTISIEEIK